MSPMSTTLTVGICCDMWQPYTDVVKARAPNAILVFGKFHIVQHLTKAVDQVPRVLQPCGVAYWLLAGWLSWGLRSDFGPDVTSTYWWSSSRARELA